MGKAPFPLGSFRLPIQDFPDQPPQVPENFRRGAEEEVPIRRQGREVVDLFQKPLGINAGVLQLDIDPPGLHGEGVAKKEVRVEWNIEGGLLLPDQIKPEDVHEPVAFTKPVGQFQKGGGVLEGVGMKVIRREPQKLKGRGGKDEKRNSLRGLPRRLTVVEGLGPGMELRDLVHEEISQAVTLFGQVVDENPIPEHPFLHGGTLEKNPEHDPAVEDGFVGGVEESLDVPGRNVGNFPKEKDQGFGTLRDPPVSQVIAGSRLCGTGVVFHKGSI